jgi:GT2 family glycosyltransferase
MSSRVSETTLRSSVRQQAQTQATQMGSAAPAPSSDSQLRTPKSRAQSSGRRDQRSEDRIPHSALRTPHSEAPSSKASIIIPVFNQAGLTTQCLRTIVGHENCEVIVVDDSSTDSTREALGRFGRQIKVVEHEANSGFAQSCNDGAAVAEGEYLVFLNNDTIPQAGWLEALVHYADTHPPAAAVGAKLVYPNNTIQHAGVVICQDRYPRHIYTGFAANHPAVSKSRRFQIVTGACMLVRQRVFREMGGFDTAFRNGFEDVDLCLRMGGAGHQIHYCAESVLCHLESVSPGRWKNEGDNFSRYRASWINRVQPDDIRYYLEDKLLTFSYEGSRNFHIRVSPLLAVVDGDARKSESEQLLIDRARQAADLTRENAHLRAELCRHAPDSPCLQYDQLRQQIREAVRHAVPPGGVVLVASKGDGALLDLPGCRARHFPQTELGAYAGHHPAHSAEAIAHLEALRAKAAEYLLIPATSLWWLDHYADFRQHLDTHYPRLEALGEEGIIYSLARRITTPEQDENSRTGKE